MAHGGLRFPSLFVHEYIASQQPAQFRSLDTTHLEIAFFESLLSDILKEFVHKILSITENETADESVTGLFRTFKQHFSARDDS